MLSCLKILSSVLLLVKVIIRSPSLLLFLPSNFPQVIYTAFSFHSLTTLSPVKSREIFSLHHPAETVLSKVNNVETNCYLYLFFFFFLVSSLSVASRIVDQQFFLDNSCPDSSSHGSPLASVSFWLLPFPRSTFDTRMGVAFAPPSVDFFLKA